MKSTHQVVLESLSQGRWLAPHDVEERLRQNGVFISSAAVSSRMRDVKKPQYGRHCLVKQRRKGTGYYEYRVIKEEQKGA